MLNIIAGLFLANVAIPSCFVDTLLLDLKVSPMFPKNDSYKMVFPSLIWVLLGKVPQLHWYYETLRLLMPNT